MRATPFNEHPVPTSVMVVVAAIGLESAFGLLLFFYALSYDWVIAAFFEPGVVLTAFLSWGIGHGWQGSRWSAVALYSVSSFVYLIDYFNGNPWFNGDLLIEVIVDLAICMILLLPRSSDFFAARAARRRGQMPPVIAPMTARQLTPQAPVTPGWHQVGNNPNEQRYWDGMSWIAGRQWTAAGYRDLPLIEQPRPMTAAATPVPARPQVPTWAKVVIVTALAAIMPVAAFIRIETEVANIRHTFSSAGVVGPSVGPVHRGAAGTDYVPTAP